MKRRIIVFFVLSAGAAFGLWKSDVFDKEEKKDTDNVHVVKKGTLSITLTERGTLKAKKSTQIKAEIHGKLSWLAEEGAKVKKGDVIVKMDTEQVQQMIDTLTNQITQGEAELKSADTEVTVQEGQNNTNIEKAELQVEVAKVELQKFEEADTPARERDMKLAIDDAKTQLARAEHNVKATKTLKDEDFATQNDLDDAELALKKARNGLTTAEMKWDSYKKYELPIERKRKHSAVTEADRGLERAKQQASAQLNAKKARLTQRKVSLARTKQQHKMQTDNMAKMEMKAPTDGTILIGDPDNPWNNERIKVGQQIWQGMVLMTLPDSRELGVVIQVHEADIAKLKKGMKAFVKSETQKDQIFDAEIDKIDTVANAGRRWGGDSVKRFKVELNLLGMDLDLKTGTSAEVEVQVDEIADVLTVPAQSIHAKEDKYFCYVKRGNKSVRMLVDPGLSNDSFAIIEFGLKEGDKVLLATPDAFEDVPESQEWKDYIAKKKAEEKKKKEEAKKKAEEARAKRAEQQKKMKEAMAKKRKEAMEKAKAKGAVPAKPVGSVPAKPKGS